MKRLLIAVAVLCMIRGAINAASPADSDPVLRAMRDELERSRQLRVIDLDVPYYIEYSIEDQQTFQVQATLGALINANVNRSRIPQVAVRVGSYEFDNTNHIYSGYYGGARYDADQLPLDDAYNVIRQDLWLGTDRAYKAALESIGRKRATLKNINVPENLPDFYKAPVSVSVLPVKPAKLDQAAWTAKIQRLSGIFSEYPEVLISGVELQSIDAVSYFANSEGTLLRTPDSVAMVTVRANALGPDGSSISDAAQIAALNLAGLPNDAELERATRQVAENVRALLKAPVGEAYTGPVLFEPLAAAQFFSQMLGDNLRIPRRPLSDPNRPAPFSPSDFESRVGSRILPDTFDVVDDATQTEYQGHMLIGNYPFDMDGVPPRPVIAVQKGVLKDVLRTRQPIKGFNDSTGSARLAGGHGARAASVSNLFVKSSETQPMPELKKRLIDMCKQRNKPYGLLVRKLDYPAGANLRDLQSLAQSAMQGGSGSRPLGLPELVYRVYPDGREELIRGVRFRGVSTRSMKDILAASTETAFFDFVNNGAPFAVIGAGGYLAPTTVVAPGVLFDEMELEHPRDEQPKPPIVPPPAMEPTAAVQHPK